jgi:hypothetical protein
MQQLDQLISIAGALLVLAPYFALQRGWLKREDRAFNALNLAGSLLLTYVAVVDQRVGFILLEGAWALLSVPGTLGMNRARG